MHCPKCGYEYREGFTMCTDCGVELVIETPLLVGENSIYAGFAKRFLALIIDLSIYLIIIIPVTFVVMMMVDIIFRDNVFGPLIMSFISLILNIVPLWLYNALLESSKYQGSIGKYVMKIIVVDLDGNKISFGKATARHFSKLLSSFAFGVGFLIVASTKKQQGFHDMIANTLVVKKGYESELACSVVREENDKGRICEKS